MAEGSISNVDRYKSENHSALVFGHTGETGGCLVKQLDELKLFKRVVMVGRREIPLSVGPEFEQKIIDFEKLDDHVDIFKDFDVCFYTLGSTISGSGKKTFVKVDRDYLMKVAEMCKAQSCKHFSLVSSAWANKNSSSLYLKIKGETEESLKAMEFDRLSIFQPACLLGEKKENLGSRFLKAMMKPIFVVSPTSLSVHRELVAKAMIVDAISTPADDPKMKVFSNKDIHAITKQFPKET